MRPAAVPDHVPLHVHFEGGHCPPDNAENVLAARLCLKPGRRRPDNEEFPCVCTVRHVQGQVVEPWRHVCGVQCRLCGRHCKRTRRTTWLPVANMVIYPNSTASSSFAQHRLVADPPAASLAGPPELVSPAERNIQNKDIDSGILPARVAGWSWGVEAVNWCFCAAATTKAMCVRGQLAKLA